MSKERMKFLLFGMLNGILTIFLSVLNIHIFNNNHWINYFTLITAILSFSLVFFAIIKNVDKKNRISDIKFNGYTGLDKI